jgi:predicted ATPase
MWVRLDEAPMRLRAMDGLLVVHTMRAEFTAARALGEEMIALAEHLGNPVTAANARLVLGTTLLSLGEIEAGRDHGERVRALLDAGSPSLPSILGVSCSCLLASACMHLGLVAQARALRCEALARAGKLRIPHLRVHATNFAAQACALLRDVMAARAFAEETVHLATEYGFSVFRIAATMVRGWCDVKEGRVADGLADLRGAFNEYATTGQRISTTAFSLLLAEAYLVSGDVAGANEVVGAALAFTAETGERVCESELYRLRGECLLANATTRGPKTDATVYFERALALAAERNALLFELRAATSLCRVRKPARERLARLVDRFDADNDCADLQTARALLGPR